MGFAQFRSFVMRLDLYLLCCFLVAYTCCWFATFDKHSSQIANLRLNISVDICLLFVWASQLMNTPKQNSESIFAISNRITLPYNQATFMIHPYRMTLFKAVKSTCHEGSRTNIIWQIFTWHFDIEDNVEHRKSWKCFVYQWKIMQRKTLSNILINIQMRRIPRFCVLFVLDLLGLQCHKEILEKLLCNSSPWKFQHLYFERYMLGSINDFPEKSSDKSISRSVKMCSILFHPLG